MKLDKDVLDRLRSNPDFQKYIGAMEEVHADYRLRMEMAGPETVQVAQGMARALTLLINTAKGR